MLFARIFTRRCRGLTTRAAAKTFATAVATAALFAFGASAAYAIPNFDTVVNAPADGTRYFTGLDIPGGTVTFTGSATSAGWSPGDTVTLRCYSWATAGSWTVIQSGVALDGSGNFSLADVPLPDLAGNDCVVVAVPTGQIPTIPDPSYVGPHLIFDEKSTYSDAPWGAYSFGDFAGQSAGSFQFSSAGDCGAYAWLRDPASGLFATPTFACAPILAGSYQPTATDPEISALVVNGANAFLPNALYGSAAATGGFPSLTNDFTVDATSGDATLTERSGISKCPSGAADPNAGNCDPAVDTGVKLTRTIHQSRAGQSAFVSDVFTNTTSSPATLSLAYYSEYCAGWTCSSSNIVTAFPGRPDFTDPPTYTPVPGPIPAAGTIFTHDSSVPDGSTAAGRIATTIFPAADDAIFDSEVSYVLRFSNRQIPVGGSLTINQELSQAFSQAQLNQLAAAAADDVTPKPTFAAAGKLKTTYNKRKKTVTVLTGRQVQCPVYGENCAVAASLATKINKKTGKSAAPARAKWKTYQLGTASLTVPAGAGIPLSVKLSRKGAALLKKYKKLAVTLKVNVTAGPHASASETLKLKIKMPKLPKRR